MKISFCTTCGNRREHLERTLRSNLKASRTSMGFKVEFVVLDYNSQDGLKEWVFSSKEIAPYLEDGTIIYARTEDHAFFRMAHAKNMAARIATGNVICNLDADNFTDDPNHPSSTSFVNFLGQIFTLQPESLVTPCRAFVRTHMNGQWGASGRIAVSKNTFLRLGGYDESGFASEFGLKHGWGLDDDDFLMRAENSGSEVVLIRDVSYLRVIEHSHELRVINLCSRSSQQKAIKEIVGRQHMNELEKLVIRARMNVRPLRTNRENFGGGTCIVYHQGRWKHEELRPLTTEILHPIQLKNARLG